MTDPAERFVGRMGAALNQAGLPRHASLVLAAMLVDDDGRMTAAELAASVGASPASISGGVNHLLRVGMVRRERERGSRRDVYVVDDDTWHGAMMRTDQLYAPMIAALSAGMAEIGERSPAYRRLLLTREFLAFVDDEMVGLMERWELHRTQVAAGEAAAGVATGGPG